MFPVQLTTKNIELTTEVKYLVNLKLEKLEKRLSIFPPDGVSAVVMLKKRIHRSEDDLYTVRIALYIPSRTLHAHQDGYTLEESLVGGVEDLEDQLERYKGKLTNAR